MFVCRKLNATSQDSGEAHHAEQYHQMQMRGCWAHQVGQNAARQPDVWHFPRGGQGPAAGPQPGLGAHLVSSQPAGLTAAGTERCLAAAVGPGDCAGDSAFRHGNPTQAFAAKIALLWLCCGCSAGPHRSFAQKGTRRKLCCQQTIEVPKRLRLESGIPVRDKSHTASMATCSRSPV